MAGFRKRTYAGKSSKRAFKKRRTAFKRRSAKTTSYSTQSTRGNTFGFRTKKIGYKRYKNHLWNSTLFKSHYRSIFSDNAALTTPVDGGLAGSIIYQAIDPGARFWTAAGGAIDIDGGTMPLFTDDIILRGGVCDMTIENTDATSTDIANIGVYFVKSSDIPDLSSFNVTTRPRGWEPSAYPEFKEKVGKILQKWEVSIKPGEQYSFKRRLGVQKIDIGAWTSYGTGRFYWILVYNSINDTGASFTHSISFNVSFVGDTVGTT